jgi:hypothetical protein
MLFYVWILVLKFAGLSPQDYSIYRGYSQGGNKDCSSPCPDYVLGYSRRYPDKIGARTSVKTGNDSIYRLGLSCVLALFLKGYS